MAGISNMYELAEFLVSSWKLAAGNKRMPTSHGILDAALYRVKNELPPKFSNTLNFGNTRVGFRCYELPQVLYSAQANLLTSEPNPTYLTTEIQISEETAFLLLYRLGINIEEAQQFGNALVAAVAQASAESELTSPGIVAEASA